jgi:hypothetical protein
MGSFLGMSNTGLIVGVILVVAIPIIIGRVRGAVAWAYERKMEATKMETLGESDISARLERLEQAVEIIAGEMQRLSEAQKTPAEISPSATRVSAEPQSLRAVSK